MDESRELLDEARRLTEAESIENITFVGNRAEDTGLEASSVDAVTAGQCWHWFDRKAASNESRRVLRPGGRIIIAHFDWIPSPDNIVAATESLIVSHNPSWNLGGGTGVHAEWFADLAQAKFESIESFSFDCEVPYSHEQWRGRIRASAGISASLPPDAVKQFDAQLQKLLASKFPDEPIQVPHRVWWITARKPLLTA